MSLKKKHLPVILQNFPQLRKPAVFVYLIFGLGMIVGVILYELVEAFVKVLQKNWMELIDGIAFNDFLSSLKDLWFNNIEE